MFAASFASVFLILADRELFSSSCHAQELVGVTYPSIEENRTIRNEQQAPIPLFDKRNDRWPLNVPVPLNREVTHSGSYQYSPWQQPPIPANYYLSGPPRGAGSGQVRSEHYAYLPDNVEYSHPLPIVSQGSGTSLSIGTKHLAIVSFIGLLLLFAIIQNSLMTAKRKDAIVEALTGREKRDLFVTRGLKPMTPEQEEILNDDAKLRCIQRTLCLENRKVVENLGFLGTKLAEFLTNGVKKSVETSSGWDRLVEDAGKAGVKGEDCSVLYRDCTATPGLPSFRQNKQNSRNLGHRQAPLLLDVFLSATITVILLYILTSKNL